jgi:arabinogalactan endo-1,4-beta-galactosidase
MSKQMKPEKWMTEKRKELAHTLYIFTSSIYEMLKLC